MKNIFSFLAILLFTFNYAQTDPIFFNFNNINPAFVSSKDNLSVGVNYFVDHMDNLSSTEFSSKMFSAKAYTSIKKKFGVGVAFSNYNFNVLNVKNAHVDFSYKYQLNSDMSLSFGTSVGFIKTKTDYTELFLPDGDTGIDDLYANQNQSQTQYGVGMFYTFKKLQIGLSIPNLNKKDFSNNDLPNDFVISGLFKQTLSEKTNLEFGAYYVVVPDYSNQYYLSANAVFKKIVGVGVNYRENIFGIQLNSPKIANLFIVGLKFDFANDEYFSNYNNIMPFVNLETKSVFN